MVLSLGLGFMLGLQQHGELAQRLVSQLSSGLETQLPVKTWFNTLKKPFFTPPNSVFSVAWTFLKYISMGVCLWAIWYKNPKSKK
jgi:tryptophan-rich sensory protein